MEEEYDGELIPYQIIKENEEPYLKQLYWDLAIGLQKVDNLTPSKYMTELVKKNVHGEINTKTVENLLYKYYSDKDLEKKEIRNEKECDMVSTRIVELIDNNSFTFRPISLSAIHKYLFKDIYDFAGIYRTYNILKEEPILNGNTVNYTNYEEIDMMLEHDFSIEKNFDYTDLSPQQRIERFAEFTSRIWEVHPFGEGNTRTVAVLMIKYLKSRGYTVNNDLFKKHSAYFRNALVRSNYTNDKYNISSTSEYLIKFYENLLLGKKHELKSKDLLVTELF